LDSDTVLINRRRYILHPRGVKFTSASVAGDSPTNAELETGSNWTRVFENKNVRIVASSITRCEPHLPRRWGTRGAAGRAPQLKKTQRLSIVRRKRRTLVKNADMLKTETLKVDRVEAVQP
jgi:hypothetical protein